MHAQSITDAIILYHKPRPTPDAPREGVGSFTSILDGTLSPDKSGVAAIKESPRSLASKTIGYSSSELLVQASPPPVLKKSVAAYTQQSVAGKEAAAYTQQSVVGKEAAALSDWQKYKDDQLLRNPGGDHYYLDQNRVSDDPTDRESFLDRVGKTLSDVAGNVVNFFKNLFMGSKIRYRDENNQIKETTERGLVGTVVDFFKDLGSALTFGLWHPDSDKEPEGFVERLSYFGSKLKQAFLGDLVEGVPNSINHMGKNIILAGLNLVQVIPDATIGNFEAGRKLTTTIFDNGQVMVEYLTDVIPSGNAWFRVHASNLSGFNLPILYNLQLPERAKDDPRWQYVRNTPFRKTIETIGTLLADIATIGLAGQTGFAGNEHNGKKQLFN